MRYEPHWGSHIPMLHRTLALTDGPVLELGMGYFSTPLLHWLCFDEDRELRSLDNDPRWVDMHAAFRTDWHEVALIEDWDDAVLDDRRWSVVLVDHGPPERRAIEALRLADHAEFILLHDTGWKQEKHYGYKAILGRFAYRLDYNKPGVHAPTTVVSNVRDPALMEVAA